MPFDGDVKAYADTQQDTPDAALILYARSLIEDPAHWCQLVLHRRYRPWWAPWRPEVQQYCATGALNRAYSDIGADFHSWNTLRTAAAILALAAKRLYGQCDIEIVNDNHGHAAVLATMTLAAEMANGR